jgi:hypothetical protein
LIYLNVSLFDFSPLEEAKAFARVEGGALYAKAIANAITSAIIRPAATATPLTTLQAASSL